MLSDNIENKEIFNITLNLLIVKQTMFHNQFKELSSYVALMGIDEINKTKKILKINAKKY